jgi:hypothetical protein
LYYSNRGIEYLYYSNRGIEYSTTPLLHYSITIPVFQYSSIPVLVADRSVGFPNVGLSEPEFA